MNCNHSLVCMLKGCPCRCLLLLLCCQLYRWPILNSMCLGLCMHQSDTMCPATWGSSWQLLLSMLLSMALCPWLLVDMLNIWGLSNLSILSRMTTEHMIIFHYNLLHMNLWQLVCSLGIGCCWISLRLSSSYCMWICDSLIFYLFLSLSLYRILGIQPIMLIWLSLLHSILLLLVWWTMPILYRSCWI